MLDNLEKQEERRKTYLSTVFTQATICFASESQTEGPPESLKELSTCTKSGKYVPSNKLSVHPSPFVFRFPGEGRGMCGPSPPKKLITKVLIRSKSLWSNSRSPGLSVNPSNVFTTGPWATHSAGRIQRLDHWSQTYPLVLTHSNRLLQGYPSRPRSKRSTRTIRPRDHPT
jgi:hypothetical protein